MSNEKEQDMAKMLQYQVWVALHAHVDEILEASNVESDCRSVIDGLYMSQWYCAEGRGSSIGGFHQYIEMG